MGVQKALWATGTSVENCSAFSRHLQLVITHVALVFHVIGSIMKVHWFLGFLNGNGGLPCNLSSSSLLCLFGLEHMFMLWVSNATKKSKKWVITSE